MKLPLNCRRKHLLHSSTHLHAIDFWFLQYITNLFKICQRITKSLYPTLKVSTTYFIIILIIVNGLSSGLLCFILVFIGGLRHSNYSCVHQRVERLVSVKLWHHVNPHSCVGWHDVQCSQ